ncbi:MAG: DNA primase [Gammaproteobacteria bacterium]
MSKHIPQTFIRELVERSDIVTIINSRLSLKKRGANFLALCPFHQEKSPSFTVSPSKQIYHCFGCGVSGNVIAFLRDFERVTFTEAIEILASQLGLSIPYEQMDGKEIPHEKPKDELYAILNRVKEYYHKQLLTNSNYEFARDYLAKRGLDLSTIKEYGLGFAPPGWDNLSRFVADKPALVEALLNTGMLIKKDNHSIYDRFRNRIMFPIHDQQGRVIAFGGRTLTDELPKYLNSPETLLFHKSRELYGLYFAKQQREMKSLIVVEGYMDVLALAQAEIKNAVGTLGTAIGSDHLKILLRYTRDIIFCFDGDLAGRKAAWRALENCLPLLRDGLQTRFIFLPEGEDPDSFVKKNKQIAFLEKMKTALPLSDFFFQYLIEQVDLNTLEGKARLSQLALPLLEKIPDAVFVQMMQERLANILRIESSSLKLKQTVKPIFNKTKSTSKRLTPMRRVLSLILQLPSLAINLPSIEEINTWHLPGKELLLEILTLIQNDSKITTGIILEHFREHEYQPLLSELATLDWSIPESGFQAEFQGSWDLLKSGMREQEIESLLSKASQMGLTNEEKAYLQNLLKVKVD